MTTHRQSTARDLARDQSGAIMVIGTFMAIFLTAALFFILGTGEAIVYRERVQDAADAVAFSSAGIHARGMNIIVILNMIMAAILAVLVALKMLVVMAAVVTAAACVITLFFPPAATACAWGVNITDKINKAANAYEKVVKVALPILSYTQKAVAITTPYVALAKSPGVADKYGPLVTGGITVSPSMVPCVPTGGSGFCGKDAKLGLPVEEDDFSNLCKKATEYVVDLAFFWMPGGVRSAVKLFTGAVTSTFPGFFCGGGGVSGGAGGSFTDQLAGNLKDLAKKACEEQEKKEKQDYQTANGNTDGFSFDMGQCKEDREKDMKDGVDEQLGQGMGQGLQGSMNTNNMTSKKVYEGAKHGGFYFQVFGFANAEADWPRRTDKGILIATTAGGMDVPANMFTAMRFAQGEFYFHKSGGWDENKENAMWELAWRARLRRVRPMSPDIAEFSFSWATGKLTDLIGSQITQKLMDGDIFKFILGQSVFDQAQSWLKKGAASLGQSVDKIIDSKLQFLTWEIIH